MLSKPSSLVRIYTVNNFKTVKPRLAIYLKFPLEITGILENTIDKKKSQFI